VQRRNLAKWFWRVTLIASFIVLSQPLRALAAKADVATIPSDGSLSVTAAETEAPRSSDSSVGRVAPTDWLPQSLALGSWRLGPLKLQPTLNVQLDWFAEGNNGWGGHFAPPLQESRFFFEHSNKGGLNADLDLEHYGKLTGRVSAIFAMTGGGLNAAATNYGDIQARDHSIEEGYVEWRSGDLFSALGEDALKVIGGRYTYQIGDGFLFYNGVSGGGNRAAAWLAPHHAFDQSAILHFNAHGVTLEGFYLSPNDEPATHTELVGVDTELQLFARFKTGLTYANIFRSDTRERHGLNVMYWRGEGTPFRKLRDFYLASSVAVESNGNRVSNALGWYITPSYTFSQLPWQPTLYYRYASFSGGGDNGNRNFDPLFYGMSDWGTWYQGEILGNWIVSNSNLNSHQIRLNLSPNDTVNMNVIYYHFLLDSRMQNLVPIPVEPVTSKNLADEINVIVDFNITSWWTMAITFSVDIPGRAAQQIVGGRQTWIQSGMWSGWTF